MTYRDPEVPAQVADALTHAWVRSVWAISEIRRLTGVSEQTARRMLQHFRSAHRAYEFRAGRGHVRLWLTLVQGLPPTAEMSAALAWQRIPDAWRRAHALREDLGEEDRTTAWLLASLAYAGDAEANDRIEEYLARNVHAKKLESFFKTPLDFLSLAWGIRKEAECESNRFTR